eukprot:scaffold14691_cov124-Isochrysis_galbana.AAC.1
MHVAIPHPRTDFGRGLGWTDEHTYANTHSWRPAPLELNLCNGGRGLAKEFTAARLGSHVAVAGAGWLCAICYITPAWARSQVGFRSTGSSELEPTEPKPKTVALALWGGARFSAGARVGG